MWRLLTLLLILASCAISSGIHHEEPNKSLWMRKASRIIRKETNLAAAPAFKERYGVGTARMYVESGKAQDHTRSLFAVATMFEKDGHHITIASLLRDGRPVGMRQELRPMEHDHKFMMMRALAREAQKIGADAAGLISDSWSATADPDKPNVRAVNCPDRKKFLTETAVPRVASNLAAG